MSSTERVSRDQGQERQDRVQASGRQAAQPALNTREMAGLLLQLQRTVGNRAVNRLLRQCAAQQRAGLARRRAAGSASAEPEAAEAQGTDRLPPGGRGPMGQLDDRRPAADHVQDGLKGAMDAAPASATGAAGVARVQRAIGLEFQTKTNLWRGAQDPRTTTAPGTLLPYGDEVFRDPGRYKVESDDGEVEFITDPFAEDTAGLEQLEHAAAKAADFARTIVAALPESPSLPAVAVAHVAETYGSGMLVGPHTAQGPWAGDFEEPATFPTDVSLSAKPQATFGLSLDRLHELAQQMQDQKLPSGTTLAPEWDEQREAALGGAQLWGEQFGEQHRNLRQGREKTGPRVLNFVTLVQNYIVRAKSVSEPILTQEQEAKVRATLERDIPSLEGAVTKAQLLATSHREQKNEGEAQKAEKAGAQFEEELEEAREGLAGLAEHAKKRDFYGGAAFEPLAYPKAAHPVMARTNFKVMLGVMDLTEQEEARTITAESLEKATGRQPNERLYPGGYYKDTLDPTHWGKLTATAKAAIEPGPTIGEWLATIFPPEAIATTASTPQQGDMQGRIAPHLPETPSDRGMGSLAKTDLVPRRESEGGEVTLQQAPVFEYRYFEGPLPPDEWPGLATAIGTVVQMLNARGKVLLSSDERQQATPPAPSQKALPSELERRQVQPMQSAHSGGEPVLTHTDV